MADVAWRGEPADLLGDDELIVRLGSDADIDQTIKSSLGHFLTYRPLLDALGRPGEGALVLSVFRLPQAMTPDAVAEGTGYRTYRRTAVAEIRAAGRELWPTDVWVQGVQHPWSSLHYDLSSLTPKWSCPTHTARPARPNADFSASSSVPSSSEPWPCSAIPSPSRAMRSSSVHPEMAVLVKTQIPVRFDMIVGGRTTIHEFALDGDEDLEAGDLVDLVSEGAPARRAKVTEIDSEGYLHLQLID